MGLRDAVLGDVSKLVALGGKMHEESQFSRYDYSEKKVANLITYLIKSEEGIALVYEQGGEIVGGFLGAIAEHYFGHSTQSFDFALFVDPDNRASRAGYALLKGYVDRAKSLGVNEILIGNSTGVESDRVEKLFRRMGFDRVGGNYRMCNKAHGG